MRARLGPAAHFCEVLVLVFGAERFGLRAFGSDRFRGGEGLGIQPRVKKLRSSYTTLHGVVSPEGVQPDLA